MAEANRGLMFEVQPLNQETNDRVKRIIERHMNLRNFKMSCGFISMAVAEITAKFLREEKANTGQDHLTIAQFERLLQKVSPSNDELFQLIEKHVQRIVALRAEYINSHSDEFELLSNFDPEALSEFKKGPVGIFEISHFIRADSNSSQEGEDGEGQTKDLFHFIRRSYLQESTCEFFAQSDMFEIERLCLDEESPFRGDEKSGFIEVPRIASLLPRDLTKDLLSKPAVLSLKSSKLNFRATESLGQPPHTMVPFDEPIGSVPALAESLASGTRSSSSSGRWLSLPVERDDGTVQRNPALFLSLEEWGKSFFSGAFRLDQEGNSCLIDCAGHFQVLLRTRLILTSGDDKVYTHSGERKRLMRVFEEKGLKVGDVVDCSVLINSLPCLRSQFALDTPRFSQFHEAWHPTSVRNVIVPFPFFGY